MLRKFIPLLSLLALMTISCSSGPAKVSGPGQKTASGVEFWDLKVGSGAEAAPGKRVKVHYTGWLANGTKFDSSRDRYEPFSFVLGQRQVIKGWEEGMAGMKVGGLRQLRIPPELGYGARGAGPIPPNSTLIFEIELMDVK